jgi:hypothetical protein
MEIYSIWEKIFRRCNYAHNNGMLDLMAEENFVDLHFSFFERCCWAGNWVR